MIRRPIARRPGGLLAATARTAVVAGTATAVSGRVAGRQAARAQQAADAQAQQPAPPQQPAPAPPAAPAPAAAAPVDVVSQLTQLAALRDSGVLTEEEFAAQKAKILAS